MGKFLNMMLLTLGLFAAVEAPTAYGQPPLVERKTVHATIQEGDTLLMMELPPFDIKSERIFKNRLERYRYNRTVRNVQVAYPYARLAGMMYRDYANRLSQLDSERERRNLTKELEEEIRREFEEDLMRLNFSQGLILIKLIDRETSQTSYDLLRDFRGMFSALFWQSFGRLFGYNLKTAYDPDGEDWMIEEIVLLLEAGLI